MNGKAVGFTPVVAPTWGVIGMRSTIVVVAVGVVIVALSACGGTRTTSSSSTDGSPTPSHAPVSVVPPPPGAAGTQLWVDHYPGPGSGGAGPGAVVVSSDGAKVYVTGSAGTVAYDAITGSRLWVAASEVFAGSGGSTPAPTAALSKDGRRLFLAGTAGRVGDVVSFGYDAATGRQLWTARYDGPGGGADGARAVAVGPDGRTVYVEGISAGPTGPDITTIASDAATGAQRWIARYPGAGGDETGRFAAMLPAPQSLVIAPDGSTVFATGTTRATGTGLDYATIAYDARTGTQRWVSRYHHGQELAFAVAVDARGATVFTTGGSTGATGMDFATVAYDAASGAQRWVSRYNGPTNRNDGGGALAVTPSGDEVVVAGISETTPGTGDDYAVAAYDAATGTRLWVQRHRATSGVTGGLGLSPDGATVYGSGATSTGQDYATVAYDSASGSPRWTSSFIPGEPRSLAVSPNGTVYVTGSAGDYTTVAYHG